MKINEIFLSIQGESTTAGLPTVFVRTYGCNLRCPYCDTRYSFEGAEFKELTPTQVVETIRGFSNVRHICFTGGEPLIQIKELAVVIEELLKYDYHISIETNGTLFMRDDEKYNLLFEDVTLIPDVKGPSSNYQWDEEHKKKYMNLLPQDEVKFVVGDERDLRFAEEFMKKYIPGRLFDEEHVLISPIWDEATGKPWMQKVAEWVKKQPIGTRMQVQMHKVIWHAKKRGV